MRLSVNFSRKILSFKFVRRTGEFVVFALILSLVGKHGKMKIRNW